MVNSSKVREQNMSIKFNDVKITLLKKIELSEIHKEYAVKGSPTTCIRYKEGQEFISKNVQKPNGFCSWAWVVVQEKVVFLGLGHDYPWIKQKGTELVCCSDGLHPVIYKVERIEN